MTTHATTKSMDGTSAALIDAFSEQEEFDGVMIVDGQRSFKAHCRSTLSPVDVGPLTAVVRSPVSSVGLISAPRLRDLVIRSDPDLRQPYVQVEGHLKKSTGNMGHEVSQLRVAVRDIFRYKVTHLDPKDRANTRYQNWFFPMYSELGKAFGPLKHGQRGITYGWRPQSMGKWDHGEWQDQSLHADLDDNHFVLQPAILFEEMPIGQGAGYMMYPQLQIQVKTEAISTPTSEREAISLAREGKSVIKPFTLALSFVAARKVRSHYQVETTFNAESGHYREVQRFVKVKTDKPNGLHRSMSFKENWDLIKDVATAIHNQDDAEEKRTHRALARYAEAHQASLLEMTLVALHSALTVIVDPWNRPEIDPDPDLPDMKGRLLTPLRKFITTKKVPWRDLIPEDREVDALFDFNNLRNQYLKDVEHEVRDVHPLRIAERLFERCFLAYLGLDPVGYKSLER